MTVLEAAFDRAVGLDDSARAAFLAEFARQHPGLVAKLAALLAADSSATDFGSPIAHSMERLIEEGEDLVIGQQFGPWKAIGTVGFGGMGAVYLVERSDGSYAQTAALKLMKPHLSARGLAKRFLRERQILASLHHPGIAPLLDGGSTEDGDPWLVMELVEGQRIDAYCHEHKLGLAARLELVRRICEAVDYAHRNLVIHRDLKPSNILVTPGGQVKILDFGIAKLLEPEDAPTDMTLADRRVLTPDFASPEQVRGERVSVATDVYSLGVLLYRLLTGTSPYTTKTDSSPFEIERAILDEEPSRPSTVVVGADQKADRQSPPLAPYQLRRKLRGDLDNIVLKCLQKEPERRYGGARALADDLERYLAGRPVEARGDAWSYRARKFIARNAIGVAATTAVVAGAAGFGIYHTSRLAAERDRAEMAAQQASEVSDILTQTFASASPFVAQGEEVSALDLLEAAKAKIADLDGQPGLQARLLVVIGESYRGLGKHDQEYAVFRQALAAARSAPEQDTATLIDIYNGLGESQRHLGDIDQALDHRRRALALSETYFGGDHPESANIRARIGATLSSAGRCPEAMPLLERATRELAGETGEFAALRLNALGVLAVCHDTLGNYAKAEAIGRRIVRQSEETLGLLEPNTIIRLGNLALVLRRQGKLDEAAQIFGTLVARVDKALPEEHPDRADYRNKLGNVLQKLGRFEEADEALAEAENLTLTYAEPDGSAAAANAYYRGSYYRDIGDTSRAIASFSKAIDLSEKLEGRNSYLATISRINLAGARLDAGDMSGASRTMDEATPGLASVGIDHQDNARIVRARLASEQRDFTSATGIFERVLARQEKALGQGNPMLVPLLIDMAAHFRRAGDDARAVALAGRAVELGTTSLSAGNWLTALATAEYALALDRAGRREPAKRMAQRARRVLVPLFGTDDRRVVRLISIR
ncbi:serine/threonine-protein kinase [Porphyrobacter sp. YT40]|uniref:serine/threonine-protein kinase n=1 Tax=Porphyrobacter sp. YT40 TaxID=2547601 RepID=UPI0015E8A7A7|nr:serine/threonine-protein kinase [Porphyrobacter sp. YT40]